MSIIYKFKKRILDMTCDKHNFPIITPAMLLFGTKKMTTYIDFNDWTHIGIDFSKDHYATLYINGQQLINENPNIKIVNSI